MHTQSDRHPQFVKITAHTSTAQLAGSTALLSMLLGQRQYETHSNLPLSKDAPVQSIHKHSGGTSEATQGCLLWGEFGISFHNKLWHELLPGFKPMPLQLSESTIQHPAAWQPLTVFDLPKHSHCHLQGLPHWYALRNLKKEYYTTIWISLQLMHRTLHESILGFEPMPLQ